MSAEDLHKVSHEYVIEQVQRQTVSGLVSGADLNFNHPVKELVWINAALVLMAQTMKTTLGGTGYQLKLNGHDRFAARDFKYFTRCQVMDHHLRSGG